VPLGEIRTDEDGHLLVLGGFGKSDSPKHSRIKHWANNDGGPNRAGCTGVGDLRSTKIRAPHR
jgi:L-Lysine epsilon oxidase N-terminal